jgi:hypothetical protein
VGIGGGYRKSVFDLLRRHEHHSPVAPLRYRIACTLVIANGFFNGAPSFINDTIKQFFFCLSDRFELSLRRSFLSHTLYAMHATRWRRKS